MMCVDLEDMIKGGISGIPPDPSHFDLGLGTDQAGFLEEIIREDVEDDFLPYIEIPPVLLSLTPDAISEEDL